MPLQILGATEGQGIFGWWSAEEVTCSRGVLVTRNHGKDEKGLHPFTCRSTSGHLSGQIWVLCGAVTWMFEAGI